MMAVQGAAEVQTIKSSVALVFLSEVTVPSVIILNTSNEQYFLPSEPIETMEQLVQFINGVLNGSAQVQIFSSFLLLLISVYVFSSVLPPPPPLLVLYHCNHTSSLH